MHGCFRTEPASVQPVHVCSLAELASSSYPTTYITYPFLLAGPVQWIRRDHAWMETAKGDGSLKSNYRSAAQQQEAAAAATC